MRWRQGAGKEMGRPEATSAATLAPHGTFEGSQDTTDATLVAGWAWDRATPDTAVVVAIHDNDALVATVTADRYRNDLRRAGIGNGRHGFICPLAHHIRDRHAHHITVRIAGTDVTLRDGQAGGLPRPITRAAQPDRRIPFFSLPPLV